MNIPRTHHAKRTFVRGFTLIEMVISAALMALIVVASYACLNAGLNTRKDIEPRVEIFQNARVALSIMTADLRCACPFPKDPQFLGAQRKIGIMEADNLDFATHNYTPKHDREGDFCEESFFLGTDPETHLLTLWRRRNPLLAKDPLAGGRREIIATGLVGARFEYFDGIDWYDTWGELKGTKAQTSNSNHPNLSGMPDAVRITLMFDPNPWAHRTEPPDPATNAPPLVVTSIARLNLTPASKDESGGSSGAASASPPPQAATF